jgi:hypothetical protein
MLGLLHQVKPRLSVTAVILALNGAAEDRICKRDFKRGIFYCSNPISDFQRELNSSVTKSQVVIMSVKRQLDGHCVNPLLGRGPLELFSYMELTYDVCEAIESDFNSYL